jgi:hypothetical protein
MLPYPDAWELHWHARIVVQKFLPTMKINCVLQHCDEQVECPNCKSKPLLHTHITVRSDGDVDHNIDCENCGKEYVITQ